jgi:hypothetical protein
MAQAPRTKILVAVIEDNTQRINRALAGHDLRFVTTCDEVRSLLEKEKFGTGRAQRAL